MPSEQKPRGGLFRKYAVLFVALVSGALLVSGLTEIYFSYQENKTALVLIQREKALAAASRIGHFVKEIERQIGWIARSPRFARTVSPDQRRIDYLLLLRQVPAVTKVSYLDSAGKEQLQVSRVGMDLLGRGKDFSQDPNYVKAKSGKTYFSPVYFRRGTEPCMTIAIAGGRKDTGVTVAEVNLKFIRDVVSRIEVGKAGHAYAVDSVGNLIAHPDISLVLKRTDLSSLRQVVATRESPSKPDKGQEKVTIAQNIQGQRVLTAHAGIPPFGWVIFLEQPLAEAFESLYASIYRTVFLVLAGIALSVLASLVLAQRMIKPIRTLQEGASSIGTGELGHRIEVRTGDELETLGEEFNRMTGQLQESYAKLEEKVEERTLELREALEQQTVISEALRMISQSTFQLQPVLETLIENATRLAGAKKGLIFRLEGDAYHLAVDCGVPPEFKGLLDRNPIHPGRKTLVGRTALECRSIHIPDVLADPEYQWPESQRLGGFRTMLGVPMLREGAPIGVVVLWREEVRPFTDKQSELVVTFADQAVIAIENVRLLEELQARTQELARSVEELQALGEVSQAVNSTLDLQTVLATIVAHAVELSETDAGAIYEFDETTQEFRLSITHRMSEEMIQAIRKTRLDLGDTVLGQAGTKREAVQVPDILDEPIYPLRAVMEQAGFRALLAVPLLREERLVGALVVRRREPGQFPEKTVDLLQNFATQSVLAIINAQLFREIEQKGHELVIASKHKSQFLANMSHELRTPMNAILGFTELILDKIYGDVPEKIKDVLERVEKNGRHLLSLINDVLDLSKIEAGQLTLAIKDYSMNELIQTVFSSVESLAAEKKIELKYSLPQDLASGKGDEHRIAQVLLNLLGNAIKFTEDGEVKVDVAASNGMFLVSVSDTGPGLSEEQQQWIFNTDFHR